MKKVPSHGYVRITGPAAGRPAERLSQRLFDDDSETVPPFLIGKTIIGRFSKKEWASEGAWGGHVGENGWFSLCKSSGWDVSGIFEE